jgi:hypothetical protein
MCPVKACAELITIIYKSKMSPDKIPNMKINTIVSNGKVFTIPSSMVLDRICTAVHFLGKEKQGFTEADVGTHSNRSGGAMGNKQVPQFLQLCC